MLYLQDNRNGHLYGSHVVAAIKRVRALAQKGEGGYDMRQEMASFVGKLSYREMCAVLKEQKGWRQARDFFAWMKLQICAGTVKLSPKCCCLHNCPAHIWANWKDQAG